MRDFDRSWPQVQGRTHYDVLLPTIWAGNRAPSGSRVVCTSMVRGDRCANLEGHHSPFAACMIYMCWDFRVPYMSLITIYRHWPMSVAPSWLSPLPASTTSALPTCIGPSCPPSSVTLLRHAAGKAALVAPRVHLEQFRPPLPSGCNTYAHDELMSAVMVHIARSWRGSSALPHAAQPSSAFQPAHSC